MTILSSTHDLFPKKSLQEYYIEQRNLTLSFQVRQEHRHLEVVFNKLTKITTTLEWCGIP
jgi:hypothetical protein